MVDLSLRIWHAITTPEAFQGLQKKIVSIFKETLSINNTRVCTNENFG